MIDFAVERCGKLDILVNNAGIMDGFEPIGDISDERWDKVFAVNVKGPMYAMRKAVQVMLGQETKGNIVNVASIGGTNGARAGAAYTASKHALVGMTENTGYMYAHEGIRCNAICPGWVLTPLVQKQIDARIAEGVSPEQAEHDLLAEKQPSLAFVTPEQLGGLTLFLCSEAADQVRGAAWNMDGGWVAQ